MRPVKSCRRSVRVTSLGPLLPPPFPPFLLPPPFAPPPLAPPPAAPGPSLPPLLALPARAHVLVCGCVHVCVCACACVPACMCCVRVRALVQRVQFHALPVSAPCQVVPPPARTQSGTLHWQACLHVRARAAVVVCGV